jgi:membrane protease YdiL (CAAX protease family)
MEEPYVNAGTALFAAGLGLASLATWIYIEYRWRRNGTILEYEPRRPVPWGPAAASLACVMTLLAIASNIVGAGSVLPDAASQDPTDTIKDLSSRSASIVVIVGMFTLAVACVSKASVADLGLPTSARQLGRDIAIGAVALLAALVPVFTVLWLLIAIFGEPPNHPLIETLVRDSEPSVIVFGVISAVLVAPICEEIMFRLLLQGWLEKWEDGREIENQEAQEVQGSAITGGNAAGPSSAIGPRWLLPHGWLPILFSSTLFALAHAGVGMAPFALFFLAIALGFTYQRTHRILPCVTTHALFNAANLVALWLSTSAWSE